MIKAKPKPIEEIIHEIKDCSKVLVVGCNGCVTVCEAGGLKEVETIQKKGKAAWSARSAAPT